jgi:chemotaxis protein methyltransferase CheR
VIAGRLGLQFDETQSGFLGDVLRRRLAVTGRACKTYLDYVECNGDLRDGTTKAERGMPGTACSAEIAALASELTVPETYFFRHSDQFSAFAQVVIPDLRRRAEASGTQLRLLSAGCASGEEAYSLAITLRKTLGSPPEPSILAVDINPTVLERARKARYSSWSLRETSPDDQDRWFVRSGDEFVLDESIRTAVRFERRNLAADDLELWRPGAYDVIFCRNVMMYFTPANARSLLERVTRSLVPGGYLFLGHAETLRGRSDEFQLCHSHDTFYYRRTLAAEDVAPDEQPATQAVATGQRWDLASPLDLLRQERFADALALVEALPIEAASDPDVLLLHAVLLTLGGLLEAAKKACVRLLEIDTRSAGAHHLLALCHQVAGNASDAVEQDRLALHLDPGFAMPHVHLGLLARRAADVETARREFSQAVTLLQREEASRIMLFGGGFSRAGLIALCRAELVSRGALS